MRQRTGSITETEEGRFRVRITTHTGHRRTLGVYDARDEAEAQRDAALAILENEGPDDSHTVATWADAWLTAREIGRVVKDADGDWGRFRNHIAPDPIARMTLKSLRLRHVRDWLKRVKAKVARQTALNVLNVMRGMLAAAVEDELIKTNPAIGLRLPKEAKTEDDWHYATPKQQRALVLVSDEPERWIIAFAMGTGLRAGEICTLRLADVHVDGDDPHVVVRYGSVPAEPTKGKRIRKVPLFGWGLLAAKEWLRAITTWVKKNPRKLMFPRLRGGFRDHHHVLRWETWSAIVEAAGLPDAFRWHDLRHTCGSSLVSGWWGRRWTLIEVRDMLGHESVTTTERYSHLAGTALQQAARETRQSVSNGPVPSAPTPKKLSVVAGVPGPIRTGDPRFRKPEDSVVVPLACDDAGRLRAVSMAFLRAVAAGDSDLADAHRVQLGLALVENTARAVEIAEAVAGASAREERTA